MSPRACRVTGSRFLWLFSLLALVLAFGVTPAHAQTNLAAGRPTTVSSLMDLTSSPPSLVDGSTTNGRQWKSLAQIPQWAEIDLGQNASLTGLRLVGAVASGDSNLRPKAFTLSHWNGSAWETITSASNVDSNDYSLTFSAVVTGRRIKLDCTELEGVRIGIVELELLGTAHRVQLASSVPVSGGTTSTPSAAVTLTFAQPIAAADLTKAVVERTSDNATVALTPSVSGKTLTLAHAGLAWDTEYRVRIPAGTIGRADDATPNGPIDYTFRVAKQTPQVATMADCQPDTGAAIQVTFDRDVTLLNGSQIAIRNATTGVALGGISASVNGAVLTIQHDATTDRQSYLLEIPAGTLEDAAGTDNARIVRPFFAGQYMLLNSSFTVDYENWTTAKLQGASYNGTQYWLRDATFPGPTGDLSYVRSTQVIDTDYLASPALNLVAGRQYALSFKGTLESNRPITANLNSTLGRSGMTELKVFESTRNIYISFYYETLTHIFTPENSGNQYLIFTLGGSGATNAYMDGISVREVVPPVVEITSPTASATFNEGDPITITADAMGLSGAVTKVEFKDGDTVLKTFTEAPFTYNWTNYLPGAHTLSVVATDEHGGTTTRTVSISINFADGTLAPFVHYRFDDATHGWSGVSSLRADTGGALGQEVYNAGASAGATALASPKVYLFAGQTYKIQFKARESSSGSVKLAFAVKTSITEPANSDALVTWTLTETEALYETTFTVAADGGYYLTLFQPTPINTLPKLTLDEFRLIGVFNNAPTVSLTTPADGLKTVAGANVTMQATASDSDGTVTSVQFRRSLVTLGTDTTSPYSYTWTNVSEGEHPLNALATDSNGGQTVSATVNITARPNYVDTATFAGTAGSDDEAVRGSVFQSDGTLVLVGYADPASFPSGVSPTYLNGATAGQRGFVARFSHDGKTLLSLTIVGDKVLDVACDGSDNVYVAAGPHGFLKLNPSASALVWAKTYEGRNVHRVDAGTSGIAAALTSTSSSYENHTLPGVTVPVIAADGTELGTMSGAGQNTNDVVVDEAHKTVWLCGWKNITAVDDSANGANPVDIPILLGRSLGDPSASPALAFNDIRIRAYDWEDKVTSGTTADPVLDARWINNGTNNMADTYGERITLGADGYLYFTMETDGGNNPIRFDPFSITTAAPLAATTDTYDYLANTSTEPHLALTRHDPATGAVKAVRFYTNRLNSGAGSTVFVRQTGLAADATGRVYVTGSCASGLAPDTDFLPGANYSGGAYILVFSPDFTSRELSARLSTEGANYTVAVASDNKVAFGGYAAGSTFVINANQATAASTTDAFYAVGDFSKYFAFQVGEHPRLAFSASEIPGLRDRLTREPYSNMRQAILDYLADTSLHETVDASYDQALRAQLNGFLYVLTGDDSYAQTAKTLVTQVLENTTYGWANTNAKGLASFWLGTRVAYTYDWCVNAPSWDSAFDYRVSSALKEMGEMIVDNGGTEQNTETSSNWQGGRGASGGICLLATDHTYDSAKLDAAYNRVADYLNANLGNDSTTKGWNVEGMGYHFYPIGNFVGPFGIAMARHDSTRDISTHVGLQRSMWAIFAGIHPAMDAWGFGGVHPDWADDNPGIRGEGAYGLAFHYVPTNLVPAARWAYDRMMGASAVRGYGSPMKSYWDMHRGGTIWSFLYYPETVPAADPAELYDAHRVGDDSGAQGIGLFTFRSGYTYDPNTEYLAQFNARTRFPGGHNGPDGLGFRVIGEGTGWVVGGGRNNPGKKIGQATLYKAFPTDSSVTDDGTKLGTITASVLRADGGGHVIAEMATSNTGVAAHKRWFTANYDSAQTGAAATYIIADTSTDGAYWHLPTYYGNSIAIDGNTFTITAPNGATMKGTVLYPASPTITTGTQERGSAYGKDGDGNDVSSNRYVSFGSADGDYLVVLTIQPSGQSHPSVSRTSGTIADAVVQVGSLAVTHQASGVLYNGSAYSAPTATVTFAAGAHGSITAGSSTQTVAYGAAATEPTITPDSGWAFLGWDKSVSAVVKSMTVTARYAALEGTPTAPSVLQASAASATSVHLTWLDNSVGETGFVVERSTDGSNWTSVATLASGTASCNATGLTASTAYSFRVKATGSVADSAWSNTATATTSAQNALPVFTSTPVARAYQDVAYTYNIVSTDADTPFPTLTAPTLPSWLTLTDNGNGTGTLTGTPAASDTSPASVTLRVNDGVNDPVDQTFSITIDRPPVVSITSPGIAPVNIPSGRGLKLAASATDDSGTSITWTWSKVSGPGTVTFDDANAAQTGASFSADGTYVVRATASDGTITGKADLTIWRGVVEPVLTKRTLLDFGGTSYVTSQKNLATSTLSTAQEYGDNSANDDAVHRRVLDDATAINPTIGSTYTGTNARFYGAWELWNLNASTTGTRNYVLNDDTNGDGIQIGSDNGSNKRTYAFVYWKKADFLDEGATRTIRLTGDATLSATLGNGSNHYTFRFAVKNAGQWYLSQTNLATAGTLSITNWTNERWATYSPGTTVGSLRANGSAASSALTYAAVELKNVEAVGVYAESLDASSSGDRIFQIRGMDLDGLLEFNANIGPDVNAGTDQTTDVNTAVTLTGTATDDGQPTSPGTMTYQWLQMAGPNTVTISNATALTANTTTGATVGTYRFRLEASDGQITTFDEVLVDGNPAPTFTQAPSITGGTVTGATGTLSALASDANDAEGTLTYTWSLVSGPASGTVAFSANAGNSAKNTTATFDRAGTYRLKLAVADPHGKVLEGTIDVTVAATPTTISVSPASTTISISTSTTFTASVSDQFSQTISSPSLTWSTTGGGEVNASGVFTAAASEGGPYTITATAGSVSATASVTVINNTPTMTDLTDVTVREGKPTAARAFTIGDVETAAGSLAVSGASSNATLVPNANITFGGSGASRTVTVTPASGQTGTATITITVSDGVKVVTDTFILTVVAREATSLTLTPASVTLLPAASQTFTATVRDQDSDPLSPQPTITWSTTGGGTIVDGAFTASTTPGGPYTITAQASGLSATASVTISNTAPTVTITAPATTEIMLTDASNSLRIAATVSDAETTPTITWSKVSGPGTVTFVDASAASTSVSFSTTGAYVLRITASDGFLSTSKDLTVGVGTAVDGIGSTKLIQLNFMDGTDGSASAGSIPALGGTTWISLTGKNDTPVNTDTDLTNLKTSTNSNSGVALVWVDGFGFAHNSQGENGTTGSGTSTDAASSYNSSGITTVDGSRFFPWSVADSWNAVHQGTDGFASFTLSSTAKHRYSFWVLSSHDDANPAENAGRTGLFNVGGTVSSVSNNAVSFTGGTTITLNANKQQGTDETADSTGDTTLKYQIGTIKDIVATYNSSSSKYETTFQIGDGSTTSNGAYLNAIIVEATEFVTPNTGPLVACGTAPAATAGVAANLSGTVTDTDNMPVDRLLTATWSKVSGPGTVTFGNAANASTTVTFSKAGTYVLRLTGNDENAETFQELTVEVKTPYQTWLSGKSLGTKTAPDEDADSDGIKNLIEFALGSDPAVPSGNVLPTSGVVEQSGQKKMTLTFTPNAVNGLVYTIQSSTDLSTWTNETVVNSLTSGQAYTYTDATALPSTGGRFLRLQISEQ